MAHSRADGKVTNEIDLLTELTLPDNKYKRGETKFELVMSDAHYEVEKQRLKLLAHRKILKNPLLRLGQSRCPTAQGDI